ncbi:MAG: DUF5659 domain-containing protein, partial [Candidatus Saccharimonadales bacterium]
LGRMKNELLSTFSTYDLALAATLVTLGHSIKGLEQSQYGKATFIFDRTNTFDETIQAYWADGLSVNPKTYFDVLKHIKTRLYSGT